MLGGWPYLYEQERVWLIRAAACDPSHEDWIGVLVNAHECRACRRGAGHVVLDLGNQPACDYFPRYSDPEPDPIHPLQMWLCSHCGLAQLLDDPTVPEEPKGAEAAALVAQAADAVARVAAAGLLRAGARVAEYGSPHGGSWLALLAGRDLRPLDGAGQADVILDCFGMMHAADQAGALAERAAGWLRPESCSCSITPSVRSSGRASGTRCVMVTTRTTPRPRSARCSPPSASARARPGTSTSTAVPCCSPRSATLKIPELPTRRSRPF